MYVSWGDIIAVKEECEPEDIDASKTGEVKVPMQSVVDHQATHIMDLPEVKEKREITSAPLVKHSRLALAKTLKCSSI